MEQVDNSAIEPTQEVVEQENVVQQEDLINDSQQSFVNEEEVTHRIEEQSTQTTEDFQSLIHDESIKGHRDLHKFKNVDDLAKSYVSLNKLLGKRFEDFTNDEVQMLNQHLNIPDSKDAYSAPDLEGMDVNRVESFKDLAHTLKLTDAQYKQAIEAVYNQEVAHQQQFLEHKKAVVQGWKESLKKEYGQAFDDNIRIANSALSAYDDSKEVTKVLQQAGIASHPAIVKMLNKIGKDLTEDKMVHGDPSRAFSMTPHEADLKIREVRTMYRDALQDRSHRDHDFARSELQKYYQMKSNS